MKHARQQLAAILLGTSFGLVGMSVLQAISL